MSPIEIPVGRVILVALCLTCMTVSGLVGCLTWLRIIDDLNRERPPGSKFTTIGWRGRFEMYDVLSEYRRRFPGSALLRRAVRSYICAFVACTVAAVALGGVLSAAWVGFIGALNLMAGWHGGSRRLGRPSAARPVAQAPSRSPPSLVALGVCAGPFNTRLNPTPFGALARLRVPARRCYPDAARRGVAAIVRPTERQCAGTRSCSLLSHACTPPWRSARPCIPWPQARRNSTTPTCRGWRALGSRMTWRAY